MGGQATDHSYTAVKNVGLNLSAATVPVNSRKIYLKNIYSAKKLLNNWQTGTVNLSRPSVDTWTVIIYGWIVRMLSRL
jgi:hypothetical protein